MDKRKKYYMVLDTETCNSLMVNGKLDFSCSLVYDLGYQIIDKKSNVYIQRSFIVNDIFYDEKLMNSAYYADKLPKYHKDIEDGKRIVKNWYDIRKTLLEDCKEYNVAAIVAHNTPFDCNAVNVTTRWVTKSKYRYFFPYGIPLYDTLKMARDTFGKEKSYTNFCIRNKYTTMQGLPRHTAEILYKYISGDYGFIESHTGLEDVIIESEIFIACLRKHKKMRKNAFNR